MVNIKGSILKRVNKPARYVGGEFNQTIKNKHMVKCRVALCYPDLYEKGMSDIELRVIYANLNSREDTACERCYAPWPDFEIEMRKEKLPLYTLESKDSLQDFDILEFIVKDQLNYTNVINMINLAGIPQSAEDRNETHPLILIRGICTTNPAPIAKFADIIVIGDNNNISDKIMDKYIAWKETKDLKKYLLEQLKDIEGIYIPSIHTSENQIKYVPKESIINDLYLKRYIVPSTEIENDRIIIQIADGSDKECKFCQNRVLNEKSMQRETGDIIAIIKDCIKDTGINDISLIATDINNYKKLNELLTGLLEIDKKININVNNVNINKLNVELLKKLPELRKNGVIFNIPAATTRLSKVIDFKFDEKEILNRAKLAFSNGLTYIKLNFKIGLPTEKEEDIDAIPTLVEKILNIYNDIPKEKRKGKCNITVNISNFIPMPHTPFEWCGQDTVEQIEKKQQKLKEYFISKNISYTFEDAKLSLIKTVLARGDAKIADAIFTAWRNGARFDNNSDCFNFECWNKAFEKLSVDYISYANIEYDLNKKLPWDNIILEVSKDTLKQEYKEAKKEQK